MNKILNILYVILLIYPVLIISVYQCSYGIFYGQTYRSPDNLVLSTCICPIGQNCDLRYNPTQPQWNPAPQNLFSYETGKCEVIEEINNAYVSYTTSYANNIIACKPYTDENQFPAVICYYEENNIIQNFTVQSKISCLNQYYHVPINYTTCRLINNIFCDLQQIISQCPTNCVIDFDNNRCIPKYNSTGNNILCGNVYNRCPTNYIQNPCQSPGGIYVEPICQSNYIPITLNQELVPGINVSICIPAWYYDYIF